MTDSDNKTETCVDKLLLELLRQDVGQGFELIYKQYYSLVFGYLFKLSNNRDTAKDLTQDTFSKIWEKRSDLVIETSIRSYLFSTARNQFISYLRIKLKQKINEVIQENMQVLDDTNREEEELLDTIFSLSNSLTDKQQEVFRLRWIEGLSRKQIAEAMNLSIPTVDIHIRNIITYFKSKKLKNRSLCIFLFL